MNQAGVGTGPGGPGVNGTGVVALRSAGSGGAAAPRGTLSAAVIGAGAIARQHLGCLREMRGVEIAGVCDLSPAMAQCAAERFGAASWSTSHAALLEERRPRVVHVTTPPASHFAIAIDALRAGAHVLVEKPITMDLDQLDKLIAEAQARGLMLQESHNYQFNAPIRRTLGMIASGEFGPPVHVEVMMCLDILAPGGRFADRNAPHPLLGRPGGVIADFLTHLVYLSEIFVGPAEKVRTVWTKRSPASPLAHDEFRALLACARGTATLAFSAHAQPDLFWVRVHGERMRASINLFEGRLSVERIRGGLKPLTPTKNALSEARSLASNAGGSLARKLSGGPGAYEGLWTMIRLMYDAIRTEGDPPVPLAQIRSVARTVDALVRPENRA